MDIIAENLDQNDSITREQLAVILNNYAKYKGKNVNVTANTNKYVDLYKVTGYARPAMNWAVAKGVITGKIQWNKSRSSRNSIKSRSSWNDI